MEVVEPRSTLSQCAAVEASYPTPGDRFPVTAYGAPAFPRNRNQRSKIRPIRRHLAIGGPTSGASGVIEWLESGTLGQPGCEVADARCQRAGEAEIGAVGGGFGEPGEHCPLVTVAVEHRQR